ncbi:hypothetical protein [Pectobacterium versatile]|uniref:hypothetical protein n=1 Tax=Pectobacterium versatile TaxID=2488639 RepID=UPI001CCCD22F|nr:hypothetical protein [Pectobacterium versatile]
MCSDNNEAPLDIFSGEFSMSDDTWTLDAVRWVFVEKKKIIASLKGKMSSGPFNAEITLFWREDVGCYSDKGGKIAYRNFCSNYKCNYFSLEIRQLDIYIEEDICVIKKATWGENGRPYSFYGELERMGA